MRIIVNSYLQSKGQVSEENETLPIAKAVLAVSLYISTKIVGAIWENDTIINYVVN